ncbi:MAG: radical SAM protein [Acidobacteriota bacterium]
MLLGLKTRIIYGPVNSRRIGASLGINILPAGSKYCSFNCVYCQYGWTDYDAMRRCAKSEFPSRREVAAALREALRRLPSPPAFLTFSGNGEPALHPEFPEIVDAVIEMRDRFSPSSKTAILSNSTQATDSRVRGALSKLDLRIMKLDAGTDETFAKYNQPTAGVVLEDVVEGLAALGSVTIQSLFTGGPAGNCSEADIDAWVKRLHAIRPVAVQIYSLDRGYPAEGIESLNRDDLEKIGARLRSEGIAGEVYSRQP